jgi:peroxiredoxin Q/BCP
VSTGISGRASREAFLIKDGKVVWHDDSASTSQQAQDVLAQIANWGQESTASVEATP